MWLLGGCKSSVTVDWPEKIYFQLAYMTVIKPQVLTGCWSNTSLLWFVGLSIDNRQLASPRRRIPSKRSWEMTRGQRSHSFCNLILNVTFNYFCYIPFIRSQLLELAHIQGEGLHKGTNTKRWRPSVNILEAVYRKFYLQCPKRNKMQRELYWLFSILSHYNSLFKS